MLDDHSVTLDESAFFEVFSQTPSKGDADCTECICRIYQVTIKDFRDFTW